MRNGRIDANQKEIVSALRKVGASVAVTSNVAGGFPDIVAGFQGRNYLIEIKDGSKPPSGRKLTPDEIEFHQKWFGQISVVNSVDEAISLILNTNKK